MLELAAGTGIVTAGLVEALPDADITATDLNDAMVTYGSTRVPGPTWRVADAQDLPFADDVFDLVVCQFGVMFLPDRIGAYRGVRRVLEPGGSFLFNVWDTLETHEVEAAVIDVMAELFPDDPPDFLRRVPHGYADPNRIRADVQAGGLGRRAGAGRAAGRAPSAAVLAEGYCLGTPLRFELQDRGDLGDLVPASPPPWPAGSATVSSRVRWRRTSSARSPSTGVFESWGPSHLVVLGVFAVGVVVLLAIGPWCAGGRSSGRWRSCSPPATSCSA